MKIECTIVGAHHGAAREVALYLSIGGDIPRGGGPLNHSGIIVD